MGALDLKASTVVDALEDPLLVVDEAGEICACNEAFEHLVTPAGEDCTGPVETTLADHPELKALVQRGETGVVELDIDGEKRYYEGSLSDIETDDDLTVAVLHDVTDQHRQRRALERENEQLDQFASFISHDLRNPLDVAIGRTTVIDELVDDPQIEEHLDEIRASHARMIRIIQDVLTLARQGQSIDDKRDVSLANVAETAWSHVETDSATVAIQTSQTVRADRNRLEQVFENLFRNAVEHGTDAESETVRITVDTLDREAGFFVADDGPGIDADNREQVFEAGFSNADEGTGLGLAIVSNIVDAHGWDVTARESVTGGTRFEFTGLETVADV